MNRFGYKKNLIWILDSGFVEGFGNERLKDLEFVFGMDSLEFVCSTWNLLTGKSGKLQVVWDAVSNFLPA